VAIGDEEGDGVRPEIRRERSGNGRVLGLPRELVISKRRIFLTGRFSTQSSERRSNRSLGLGLATVEPVIQYQRLCTLIFENLSICHDERLSVSLPPLNPVVAADTLNAAYCQEGA